jgi:DNA topoisomerase IB
VSANTVGCCTLLAHTHVRVIHDHTRKVHIRFPGKDSVIYDKKIIFPKKIFMCLKSIMKKPGEKLFTVTPQTLNAMLGRCVPGVTAKTFRTMRASVVYEDLLNRQGPRAANEAVAKLLNHQKKNGLNLDTSRKNYIDPRIYFAYCKRTRSDPGKAFAEHAHWAGKVSREFCFVK